SGAVGTTGATTRRAPPPGRGRRKRRRPRRAGTPGTRAAARHPAVRGAATGGAGPDPPTRCPPAAERRGPGARAAARPRRSGWRPPGAPIRTPATRPPPAEQRVVSLTQPPGGDRQALRVRGRARTRRHRPTPARPMRGGGRHARVAEPRPSDGSARGPPRPSVRTVEGPPVSDPAWPPPRPRKGLGS